MEFPENFFYTKNHEWFCWDGNEGVIGITAFAAKEFDEIVYIDIESERKEFSAGDVIGRIQADKKVSYLILPVDGVILDINPKIRTEPTLVNSNPYGKGWLVRIKVTGEPRPSTLMHKEKYCRFLGC